MSDLITDILERYAKAYPHVHPDRAEQQIRQQIGRELLETFMKRAMWGNRGIEIVINEICQLENES